MQVLGSLLFCPQPVCRISGVRMKAFALFVFVCLSSSAFAADFASSAGARCSGKRNLCGKKICVGTSACYCEHANGTRHLVDETGPTAQQCEDYEEGNGGLEGMESCALVSITDANLEEKCKAESGAISSCGGVEHLCKGENCHWRANNDGKPNPSTEGKNKCCQWKSSSTCVEN